MMAMWVSSVTSVPLFKSKGLRLVDVKPMHIEGYQRHILHDTRLSVNTLRKHHEVMRACLDTHIERFYKPSKSLRLFTS